MTNPLVSITCTAYNHEKFIRDTIEGFLMQKTTFPFEILIHDDASTDNTAEIIKEYELKYPDLIKPIYQKENQLSKGISITLNYTLPRAKGKYIAMCEGDDFWTDPDKLQKQIDFLESNSDYSLCVGGYKSVNVHTKEEEEVIKIPNGVIKDNEGYTFTLSDTRNNWITKTLTLVFRNKSEILKQLGQYKSIRDVHLIYHILKTGKGYYFTEVMGTYRIHKGGIFSMRNKDSKLIKHYQIYKELYLVNHDEYCRKNYFNITLIFFEYNFFTKKDLKGSFSLFRESISLVRKPKELMLIVLYLLPVNFRRFVLNKIGGL